jgi:hypothetical protein
MHESEQPPSVQTKNKLEQYTVEKRNAKYWDGAMVLGATAIVALSKNVVPESSEELGTNLGWGLGLIGVMKATIRNRVKNMLAVDIDRQARTAELQALLPVLDLSYGLDHAISKMRVDSIESYEELYDSTASSDDKIEQLEMGFAMDRILRNFDTNEKNFAVIMLIKSLFHTYQIDDNDESMLNQHSKKICQIELDILDKYMPIKEEDSVVSDDPDSNKKSWKKYIEHLVEHPELVKKMNNLIGVSSFVTIDSRNR